MIDAVELNKTLSANIDADCIAGSVDIRTKVAGDRPTFDTFMDGGYTNILNGRASTSEGATVGRRFGATKRFGLLLNRAYDYNGRVIDNFQLPSRAALTLRIFLRVPFRPPNWQ